MELFKIGKKCKDKGFGTWQVKWLQNKVGQGFIFHVIIPANYTL